MATETADERSDDGQRTLRADARRNRARVMEAVWRLLETRSPDELNMEDVAREADIGKGTLYRHYPNKECLFDAVIQVGAERLGALLRERIPPEADAPTKLRALVSLLYDAYEEYHISIDLVLNTRFTESISIQQGSAVEHPKMIMMTRMRDILAQGVREGSFRPLDVVYTASAVFALVSPIAFAKQRESLGYGRAELEEHTVDMLWHALRADAAR